MTLIKSADLSTFIRAKYFPKAIGMVGREIAGSLIGVGPWELVRISENDSLMALMWSAHSSNHWSEYEIRFYRAG